MTIEITDVTNDGGTGYFDLLMVSINTQLATQFQLERLTGTDYATVYLGALQVTLQQAMNFALTKELTEEQIKDVNSGVSIKLATEAQIQSATEIAEAQSEADISLKEAQELNVESDTNIKETQSTQDQALKQAQETLVIKQTLTEEQNTLLATQNIANAAAQEELVDEQKLKTIEEKALLTQKGITEWAETELVAKTPGSVSGLKGEQGALYHTQANGFKHKAANDALSALMNMWSVAESQDGLMVQPNAATTTTEGRLINMAFEVYNNANAETPTYDTP